MPESPRPLLAPFVRVGTSLTANDLRAVEDARRRREYRAIQREWVDAFGWLVRACRPSPITDDVVVFIDAARGTRGGRADAAAYEPLAKAAIDGLTAGGLWADDWLVRTIVFSRPTKGDTEPQLQLPGLVKLTLTIFSLEDAGLRLHQQLTGG